MDLYDKIGKFLSDVEREEVNESGDEGFHSSYDQLADTIAQYRQMMREIQSDLISMNSLAGVIETYLNRWGESCWDLPNYIRYLTKLNKRCRQNPRRKAMVILIAGLSNLNDYGIKYGFDCPRLPRIVQDVGRLLNKYH